MRCNPNDEGIRASASHGFSHRGTEPWGLAPGFQAPGEGRGASTERVRDDGVLGLAVSRAGQA
jgi:hypothetical protein